MQMETSRAGTPESLVLDITKFYRGSVFLLLELRGFRHAVISGTHSSGPG